jgi:NADPH:quinone reductase-like Zn-dependent oxidoreductase
VLAVVFAGAGGNEVVQVIERDDPVPGPEDVLVAVEVAGVNPADVHQRAGNYPAPPGAVEDIPGLEVAGEIVALGNRVRSWAPGDRVMGLVGGGGLASRVVVHERCVVATPLRVGVEEAAAVPEAFVTAHDALRQGGLLPGARVMVRGANGAVGRAAVQIATATGATVVAPAEAEGLDLIVDTVGGEGVADGLAALAPRGTIVVVSVAAGRKVSLDLLTLMASRATIRGTVLRSRPLEEKAAAIQAFGREVVPMLADGRVSPAIDSVFEASRVTEAFDRVQARGKTGKVLVRFES